MWYIRKLILNAYARVVLWTPFFVEKHDPELDDLFWAVINDDIKDPCQGRYTMSFHSLGLYFTEIWNANQWYSWLNSGQVYKGSELVYSWRDKRPSAYVMLKFKRKLDKSAPPRNRVRDLLYQAAVERDG